MYICVTVNISTLTYIVFIKTVHQLLEVTCWCSGIILCMCPVNERRCYNVTLSPIGWAHTQNDLWMLGLTYLSCHHLTGGGQNKMAAILQTTFSNVFHWMKVMHFVIASVHQQALAWITTTLANIIVLFHNDFPPSGEQPEHCRLAHYFWQPTAGCIAIFHKYCCYTKHGGVSTNLTHWGYVTDVSKYHNADIWSMNQNILHFMFKNI